MISSILIDFEIFKDNSESSKFVFAFSLKNINKFTIRVRKGAAARVGGLSSVEYKNWMKLRNSRNQIIMINVISGGCKGLGSYTAYGIDSDTYSQYK